MTENGHPRPPKRTTGKPLFHPGVIVVTPGAAEVLRHAAGPEPIVALALVFRHVCGEWGEVDAEDARANDRAVKDGSRILSVYRVAGHKLWVITEADRSVTTILTPDEY